MFEKQLAWIAGKWAGKKLKEGPVDTKKWWMSKTVLASLTTALMGIYLTLQPHLGLPVVPEWVFALLGAAGIYGRVTATTKIG